MKRLLDEKKVYPADPYDESLEGQGDGQTSLGAREGYLFTFKQKLTKPLVKNNVRHVPNDMTININNNNAIEH